MSKDITQIDSGQIHSGSCACGKVRYKVKGPLNDAVACHCIICRKTTGHYFASIDVAPENFELIDQQGLQWYESTAIAKRGFCKYCGGQLFFKPCDSDKISVTAGTMDSPLGIAIKAHIYTDYKGDYYALQDGKPQFKEDDH